ncbi:hypothetical protein QJS04_geneDACA020518 [Acorus gramineus]|uniref:DUF7054 domain-containing protein n=1 Tax=Acorus gramineus TaxID=55184 RepID=A0AAV9ACT0_ACOGR|nr:hypothetical protein QJS04_geneDACA020518 [Acorus gramineus]
MPFRHRPATFHALPPPIPDRPMEIPRPKTHHDLLRRDPPTTPSPEKKEQQHKLTKLLLNVTVQRSLGPVYVVISPESTVEDLIRAAIDAYTKEGRMPPLVGSDPRLFELHYSQFSLENLDPKEKVISLGSRNFFMCPKRDKAATVVGVDSCSRQENERRHFTLSTVRDLLQSFVLL